MQSFTRAVRRPRALLSACAAAAVVLAAFVAGCGGDDVGPNAVARVGESTIEKSEFQHWLEAAAASQAAVLSPGAEEVAVPDPPEFTECIATKEEQARAAAEGQRQGGDAQVPSEEELRQQCEEEYELLKEQVMQFLIQAEAIRQEAEERGIELSDEEVRAQFEDLKDQSFPNEQAYQDFLESSGMTEEDIIFRVRLDLLLNEIRQDVLQAEEPTEEDVEAYYEEHKEEPPLGQPEQRDVAAVLTRTEEQAEKARQALEGGQSFDKVAKRFSVDQATKDRGGKVTFQEGAEDAPLDEAVFSAEAGELVGPIETERGFYVFEVQDVTPPSSQSLEESRETIVEILTTEREQEALSEFQERFEDELREKTVCAEGFVVAGCSNGPEPSEDPGAPTAPPSGQPAPSPPPAEGPPSDGGAGGGGSPEG